jgi:hypothetical protein
MADSIIKIKPKNLKIQPQAGVKAPKMTLAGF